MSLSTARPRNRLWILTLAVPLLLLLGCAGVLWLPDSSGFLYVSKDRSAILYDVASGKKKVLIEKLPSDNMMQPALSADGKRFAVASITKNETAKKQFQIQFHVYDLKGKEVHRSPLFAWRDPERSDEATDKQFTAMFWARTREKLIVW